MPKSVRLSKQTNPDDIQDAVVPKHKVTQPDQALYGIFSPQYAAALSASATGGMGETARIADRIALRNATREEARRYQEALAGANASQERINADDNYYGIISKQITALPEYVDRGIGELITQPTNSYGIYTSPTSGAIVKRADQSVLNRREADRYKAYSDAAGDLASKTGIIPSTKPAEIDPKTGQPIGGYGLTELLTNPESAGDRINLNTGFESPALKNTIYGTDEGLTFEQQKEIDTIRAAAKADGDDIEVNVKTNEEGDVADITYKGTPDALRRRGINPVTGKKLDPNADEQGGGSSAKPAVKNDPTVTPTRNATAITERLWPGAYITDADRDPNSALGKKHPNSNHIKRPGSTVDVRPSSLPKGTTFEKWVQRYKDAGYTVIEALDEVKHPSKHATGPHWHITLGERRDTSQMYAARAKLSPLVESVTPVGDGTTLVKLKDGTQRVYKNGRRVG